MGAFGSTHKSKDQHDPNGISSPICSADPGLMTTPKENKDESIITQSEGRPNVIETPVVKNKAKGMLLFDPRSPTQEIDRTPIAVEEMQRTRREREAALARLTEFKENTPVTSTPKGYTAESRLKAGNSATPIRYSSHLKEGRPRPT